MRGREKDPSEIGALWSREGKNGEYLTGEINGVRVICFRNNSNNPKAPAWRVLKSEPRDGGSYDQRRDDRVSSRPSRVDDIDQDIPFS